MLIDTHAHLNFSAYKDDVDEVIRRSLAPVRNKISNGVRMINVGSQYTSSKRAVEIAERYDYGVYAAIGLHPIHLETGLVKIKIDPEEIEFKTREEEFDYEKYKKLAQSTKVIAIGEIGLDYYYKPKTKTKMEIFKEKQKRTFIQQTNLAKELGLPIIFHCRFAHDDFITTLQQYNNRTIRGVIHSFTGTWPQAEKYLEMGLYLGFNGIIFKLYLDEIIKKMSLDRILLETDCPYLTPPPITGRNEPLYLKQIAEKIAKIKNVSFEKIAETTTQNAQKLFNI